MPVRAVVSGADHRAMLLPESAVLAPARRSYPRLIRAGAF
jgi:hypothetical protein